MNALVSHHASRAEKILSTTVEKHFGKLAASGNRAAKGREKRARAPDGTSKTSVPVSFITIVNAFCCAGHFSRL